MQIPEKKFRGVAYYGVLSGLILFGLMILEYLVSGKKSMSFISGEIEIPAFLLIIGFSTFYGIKEKVTYSTENEVKYLGRVEIGIWIAMLAGIIWAILSFLYITLINPDYPKIVSIRAIPPNAKGAETTILPAVAEFFAYPVIQFVWKFLLSLIWGIIVSFILAGFISKKKTKTVAS
jgi:Protein of unknown function (DUF4199)